MGRRGGCRGGGGEGLRGGGGGRRRAGQQSKLVGRSSNARAVRGCALDTPQRPVAANRPLGASPCCPGSAAAPPGASAHVCGGVHLSALSRPLCLPGPCSRARAAVPLLELAAYAGYAFVPACASLLVQLLPLPGVVGGRRRVWTTRGGIACAAHMCITLNAAQLQLPDGDCLRAPAALSRCCAGVGGTAYHVVWAYGSLCIAIFLVSEKPAFLAPGHTCGISSRH